MALHSIEIDTWPREWRELVHEFGFNVVKDMRTEKKSWHEALVLLTERRRRIEQLAG